jgi:hypothetical protein
MAVGFDDGGNMIRVPTRGRVCLLLIVAAILLAPVAATAQDDVAVVTSVAPIYQFPKAVQNPLRFAAVGSTLTVIRHQGDWTEVKFKDAKSGDRNGWIHRSHIRLYEQVTVLEARAQGDVAVVTSVAPIYLEPKVMREPLRVVAEGSALTVVRHVGDWTEVSFKDQQFGQRNGWIQRADIRLAEPVSLSSRAPVPTPLKPSQTADVDLDALIAKYGGRIEGQSGRPTLPATPAPSYRPRPAVPYMIPPWNTAQPFSTPPVPLPPYMIPLLAVRSTPLTPVPPYMIPLLAVTSTGASAQAPTTPYMIPPSYRPQPVVPYTITPRLPGINVPHYSLPPPLEPPVSGTSIRLGDTTFYNFSDGAMGSANRLGDTTFYNYTPPPLLAPDARPTTGTASRLGDTTFYNFSDGTTGTARKLGDTMFYNFSDGLAGSANRLGDTTFLNLSNGKRCVTNRIGEYVYTNCY